MCSIRSFAPPDFIALTIRNSTHEEIFNNFTFTYDGLSLYTIKKTYNVSSIDNVMAGCTIARDSRHFSENAGVIVNSEYIHHVTGYTVKLNHGCVFMNLFCLSAQCYKLCVSLS